MPLFPRCWSDRREPPSSTHAMLEMDPWASCLLGSPLPTELHPQIIIPFCSWTEANIIFYLGRWMSNGTYLVKVAKTGVADGVRPVVWTVVPWPIREYLKTGQDQGSTATDFQKWGAVPQMFIFWKQLERGGKGFQDQYARNFLSCSLVGNWIRMNAFSYELILEFLATNSCRKKSLFLKQVILCYLKSQLWVI